MGNKLRVSEKGLRFLKEREGEVLHVYKDSVGLLTVGVGHLLTSADKKRLKLNQSISQEESTRLLREDLGRFEDCVNSAVRVAVGQNQFDALVSLAFNIGEAGFRRSSVVRKLNAGDYAGAANAFLLWNKAGGRVVKGLVTRRNLERALFLSKDKAVSAAVLAARVSERGAGNEAADVVKSGIVGADEEALRDAGSNRESGADANSDSAVLGKMQETVSETVTEGNRQIEKTVTEEKTTFEPKNIPAFIPRFGKQWFLGLIPGGGLVSTVLAYVQDAPQWMVFVLGAITGIAVWKFMELVIKHREKVADFVIRCYQATANPEMHNLIPTQASSLLGRSLFGSLQGSRREVIEGIFGSDIERQGGTTDAHG